MSSRKPVIKPAKQAIAPGISLVALLAIAAYALLEDDNTLWLRGLVGAVDGTRIFRVEGRAPRAEGERLGRELAEQLLAMGADKVLAEVYGHTPS